jgi:hypothetical protein
MLLKPAASKALVVARTIRARGPIELRGADDLLREVRIAAFASLVISALIGVLVNFAVGSLAAGVLGVLSGGATGAVFSRWKNRTEKVQWGRARTERQHLLGTLEGNQLDA